MYIVSDKRMYPLKRRSHRPPAHRSGDESYRKLRNPQAQPGRRGLRGDADDPARRPNRDHRQRQPDGRGVYRTATRLRHHQHRVVCQVPVVAKSASASENSLIGSRRTLSVKNNYGYQDPFGPHTGVITRPGFARIDINKHVNGCGLVWTNHTESAPSVGTKALHDNLAWTTRSGLPHLVRRSHDVGADPGDERFPNRTKAATPAPSARVPRENEGRCPARSS